MAKSLKDFVKEALEVIQEVEPEEVQKVISSGSCLVLDVREPDEFQKGHIPGAVNIPRGMIEGRADPEEPSLFDSIFSDRSQKIICYCSKGNNHMLLF